MIHISIKPEIIFYLFNFPVTNTFITELVSIGLLLILILIIRKKLSLKPGRLQLVFESVIEYFLNLVDQILDNKTLSRKVFPLVATIFLLVVTSNWLGLLPGVGSLGLYRQEGGEELFVPLFRSPNSDLNMTLALTIISIVAIHVIGFSVVGLSKYIKKFINFKNPLAFYIGILELISEAGKFVAFALRLFGNILAGEILLVVIAFLVPLLAPLPFLGFEVLVGIVQAFIFSVLTLVFIKVATVEMDH